MTTYQYKELDGPDVTNIFGHIFEGGGMPLLLEKISKAEKDGWELVSIDQRANTAIMRKPN